MPFLGMPFEGMNGLMGLGKPQGRRQPQRNGWQLGGGQMPMGPLGGGGYKPQMPMPFEGGMGRPQMPDVNQSGMPQNALMYLLGGQRYY
jgi:hypothetical protein